MMTITLAAPYAAQRAYPVRVSLRLPELMRAGVEALLVSYEDRVAVVHDDDGGETAHVEIFDPVEHARDAWRSRRTGVPLVALTWDRSPATDKRARELGASRVLPLSVGARELLHTIEQVHRSGPTRRDVETPVSDDLLTAREAEVLREICRGRSNQQIAGDLYLSINSVKTFIRTAYRKMQVTSRSQAVLWGLSRGY